MGTPGLRLSGLELGSSQTDASLVDCGLDDEAGTRGSLEGGTMSGPPIIPRDGRGKGGRLSYTSRCLLPFGVAKTWTFRPRRLCTGF